MALVAGVNNKKVNMAAVPYGIRILLSCRRFSYGKEYGERHLGVEMLVAGHTC